MAPSGPSLVNLPGKPEHKQNHGRREADEKHGAATPA